MTDSAWAFRHRVYLRANHSRVAVKADDVRLWIEEQRSAWLESDGDRGFDAWLNEQFPEPAPAATCWGGDEEYGF